MNKQLISFDIGTKNMAYCIANVKDNNIEIKELENVNLNCSKIHQDIIDKTIDFLDYIISLVDINMPIIILIEIQMTSIMKCIQTVINTYFKLLNKFEGLTVQTLYLSPKHKLNLINKYKDVFINNDVIKNNKYKQNKVDSILFTKWLLENKYKNEKILKYFNDIKKKDDICDALLMNIFYYESFLLS